MLNSKRIRVLFISLLVLCGNFVFGNCSTTVNFKAQPTPQSCYLEAKPADWLSWLPDRTITMLVGQFRRIDVNWTCAEVGQNASQDHQQILTIDSPVRPRLVTLPVTSSVRRTDLAYCMKALHLPFPCGVLHFTPAPATTGFFLEGIRVGKKIVTLEVAKWNRTVWLNHIETVHTGLVDRPSGLLSSHAVHSLLAPQSVILARLQLEARVLRRVRALDVAYAALVTGAALLTALTMGCLTCVSRINQNRPSVLVGLTLLGLQHVVMPLVALFIYMSIGITNEQGFGLVALATMPGGGMSYLMSQLMETDVELSGAINIANSVLSIALSPSLLAALWPIFRLPLSLIRLTAWHIPCLLAHGLGVMLTTYWPRLAANLLTWVTRPLLLLFSIVLVTLGIYINDFAFPGMEGRLLASLALFHTVGFVLGRVCGWMLGLRRQARKTTSTETCMFNCLIAIPALRYSLTQPDADLVSIPALWAIFFVPTPLLFYGIANKLRTTWQEFRSKRKEKKERQFRRLSAVISSAGATTDLAVHMANTMIATSTLDPATMIHSEEHLSPNEKTKLHTVLKSHGQEDTTEAIQLVAIGINDMESQTGPWKVVSGRQPHTTSHCL